MPVLLLAAVYNFFGGIWFYLAIAGVAWYCRRRATERRWEAYIRNECALYIEEVLGVA